MAEETAAAPHQSHKKRGAVRSCEHSEPLEAKAELAELQSPCEKGAEPHLFRQNRSNIYLCWIYFDGIITNA